MEKLKVCKATETTWIFDMLKEIERMEELWYFGRNLMEDNDGRNDVISQIQLNGNRM